MSLLRDDPWLKEKVDKAIARYGRSWTKTQIEAFRNAIAFTMETHPRARALLSLARPDLHRRLNQSQN